MRVSKFNSSRPSARTSVRRIVEELESRLVPTSATWTGAASAVWATTGNWTAAPVPGTADVATFNGPSANATIDLGAGVTIGSIQFDTANAAAYTIGSGANGSQTLTLDNGGAIVLGSASANNQTIRSNVTLGSGGTSHNFSFANNSATKILTVTNGLLVKATASAGSTDVLTLSTAAGGMTLFASNNGAPALSDGANGGKLALVIQGTGTVTLGNASINVAYTGGTFLNQGTYVVNGNAMPPNTAFAIAGGTTFGGINNVSTLTNIAQQWNGDWTFSSSMPVTFPGGTVDLGALNSGGTSANAARTVTGSSNVLTVNGNIANGSNGLTIGLIKAGTATLALGGLSTFTGPTTIAAGTLSVGNVKNLGVPSALGRPTTVASGTIAIGSGTTGAILLYTGGGDVTDRVVNLAGTTGGVTLDQSATGGGLKFTGDFTATGAGAKTLTLQGSVATGAGEIAGAIVDNSAAAKTSVVKAGTGIWTLSGTNTYTGGTTLTAGTLAIHESDNLGDSSSGLVFNGGTLRILGTTLTSYASGSIGGHAATQTATKLIGFDVADPANDFTVGTALAQTTGGLTKLGAGTLTLSAVNTYSGTTTLSAGTLAIENAGSGLTQSLGGLTLAGADVELRSDNSGAGTLSTTFGALTARVLGNTANVVSTGGAVGSTNVLNVSGATGFIDKGIFFNGADFAARNATNGFVRALAYGADAGTSVADVIAASTHVKLTATPAARAGDTLLSLNLAGSGVNYVMSSGTLTAPGIVKSGGGTSTISGGAVALGAETVIRTDSATDILDINGGISGTALTKSGPGTLKLSGTTANTFNGATTVNGGELDLGKTANVNALAGPLTINNGALVKYTGTSDNMIGTTNQPLVINGTSQFDFNGISDNVGNMSIVASGANADTTPVKNTAGGGTLGLNALTITPADGFTSLIDTGTGTLKMTNNSVVVNSPSFGKAQISGNFDTGGRTLNVTGGRADYDLLVDAVVSGTGVLSKAGVGTLRLTGANTYTGATSIAAGTVTINTIQDAGSSTANSLGKPATGSNSIIGLSDTGVLQYIGSANGSSNRVINLFTATGGTFVLDASGSAAFGLSGGITNAGTSGTSAVVLTGSGDGSQGGAIANGTGANVTTLTKNGPGTWTLSGSNGYFGATTINAGMLVIDTIQNAGSATGNSLGKPAAGAASVIGLASGAALKYVGSSAGASNRAIHLSDPEGGTFTLDASGSVGFGLSGGISTSGSSGVSVVNLTGTGAGSQSGSIVDGTGANVTALEKNGSGAWSLSGTNTYSGSTTVNDGALVVVNGSALGATSSITIAGGAMLDVAAVSDFTLAQPLLAPDAGTAAVTGSLDTGGQTIDMQDGVNLGTLTVSGDVTFDDSDLEFDLGAIGSDQIVVTGSATQSGTQTIDVAVLSSATTLTTGTHAYALIAAANGLTAASFALSGNMLVVGSVTYTLSLSSDGSNLYLDVSGAGNTSVIGVSSNSFNFGRVMAPPSGVSQPLTVMLVTGVDSTGASLSITGGALGATLTSMVSGAGFITDSQDFMVGIGLGSGLGAHSDTIIVTNTGDSGSGGSSSGAGQGNAQTPISVSVTGTVVQNRVITAAPVDFGLVHVGAGVNAGTTLGTSGDSNANTSVSVPNFSANGFTVSGGNVNLVFNSSSVVDGRTLAGTLSVPGAFVNAAALSLTPGTEAGVLGTQSAVSIPLTYSASVFSGSGRWTADGPMSWTGGNAWSDTVTPSIQAAPGTFVGFANTDVAIFDGVGDGRVVNLNGATPSLSSLVLSAGAVNANYQINQGSGGAITLHGNSGAANLSVASGSHVLNVPLALASDVSVGVTDAMGSVTLGGAVSGESGIVKTGVGTVVLAGGNSFSGAVTVAGGRLLVNNPFSALVSAVWADNAVLFTTATPHGLTPGSKVVISGVNPSGFNGTYTVVTAGSGTTFTAALTANPGAYLNGGVAGSGTGSGPVFVQDGGTIGGSGRIAGPITIDDGGNLSPGNSPGTIGTGDLELKSGSIMNEEIDSASSYDIVNVTGTIDLNSNAIPNGGAKLRIILGYTPVNGTTYTIITNDDVEPISNRFRDYNTSAVLNDGDAFAAGSNRFTITYTGGVDANDIVLTVANPEIALLTPYVGPTLGGVTIVLTGINFTGASAVTFGGTPATSYSVISATQITAVAPAGSSGTVDVTVTNTTVTSATAGAGNDYTFVAPTIASVVVNGGDIVARDRYNLTPSLEGQQSVVEQLLVTFNQRVTLDPGAFAISNLSGSVTATGISPSTAAVAVTATGVSSTGTPSTGYTQYVLTFDAGASVESFNNGSPYLGNAFTTLKEGLYQLDSTGSLMHAGLATLADSSEVFWSLYGVSNVGDIFITGSPGGGDDALKVDGLALNDVYSTFGSNSNSVGPPTYSVAFDWNLDGNVDGIDLNHLYANFGTIWTF